MSEERNHYGIPMPPARQEDGEAWGGGFCEQLATLRQAVQPQDYADPHDPGPVPAEYAEVDLEPESWREELSEAERAVYDELQKRVACAVGHALSATDIQWVVEETLWQLSRLPGRARTFVLPGLGRVARVTPEPGQ